MNTPTSFANSSLGAGVQPQTPSGSLLAGLRQELMRYTPFAEMAAQIVRMVPRSAERTVALRKLLESKDAAVRAAL